MGDSLTPLDATFLEVEQADRTAHMHIGAVMIFGPPVPRLDDVCAQLDERLDALPRYRQRLSSPELGVWRWPHWEDDPEFDVRAHVRRAALPAPGGEAELLEWAGDFYSHRLDRRRPLWRMVLLEGLADGGWALATKTHHCLVDGVGSLDAMSLLLDAPAAPAPPPASPGGQSLGGLLGTPARALARSAEIADLLVRDELIGAPVTSLNRPIGEHRRLALVRTSLAELRAIGAALGGKVNDVALTAVAAGLRDLLISRGEEPPRRGLRAMVPVNLRNASERLTLGNRVSTLYVALPVAEEDPLAMFELVRRETLARKRGSQARASAAAVDLAGITPPLLHAVMARSLFGTRLFNVTVTNVPGGREPLRAFGATLRESIPIVPLAAGHSIGVVVLSYAGSVVIGLTCDRDSVPDAAVATAGIEAALERLAASVPASGAR